MKIQDVINFSNQLAKIESTPADTYIVNDIHDIKCVYTGIDIKKDEIDNKYNESIDTYLSHHPTDLLMGKGFLKELERYYPFLLNYNIDKSEAKKATESIIRLWAEVPFTDYEKSPMDLKDIAIKNNVNLFNVHLAADIYGKHIIDKHLLSLRTTTTIEELFKHLKIINEYKNTNEEFRIIIGDMKSKIGKFVFAHGCGANGGLPIAEALFKNNVDTVIYITYFRFQEKNDIEILNKFDNKNLVILPHHASDSVGFNFVLNWLEKNNIKIIRKDDIISCN